MSNIFEIGIVGMGPAGIGMAMSLSGTEQIKDTICFEKGHGVNDRRCVGRISNICCSPRHCSIISGIGGASIMSGGKFSDFPAGSGLVDFFDSEDQMKNMFAGTIMYFKDEINLKKIEITQGIKSRAESFYKQKNITYKYYDVYEFDNKCYRDFICKTVKDLKNEGLTLLDNSEIVDVVFDAEMSIFRVKVDTNADENEFSVRKLIIATGALDIHSMLIENILGLNNNDYELGIRVEAPINTFSKALSTHGDLKLKNSAGRTYCVTTNGKIISYQTDGVFFLEGHMDLMSPTGYTNLAIITKCDSRIAQELIKKYREKYNGIPIKQRFVDYQKSQKSVGEINATLNSAMCGDINDLFPNVINNNIKSFIKDVLVEAMNIPPYELVVFAPELKILRNLQLKKDFEAGNNLYIIGAATGKFRGILQAFCSGIRCGRLLVGR